MSRITINDIQVEVFKDATILDAAKEVGIYIPTLCHLDLEQFNIENKAGSCRICMVDVDTNGRKKMMPACCTPVEEGMVVKTNTPEVVEVRRTVLQLLLSDHPFECLTCPKSLDCELQALAKKFGIYEVTCTGKMSTYEIDHSSKSIKRDLSKCIMCRRCETVCTTMQTVGVLSGFGRGFKAVVAPPEMEPLTESVCVFCGQCVNACPTAALTEINYISDVWKAINNPNKKVIVQTAPAVRVGIGEEFGLPAGTEATGMLTAGLRRLGFDAVFDTNFSADLTIMEEAHELIERVKKNENLPILTSCCPGWINFLEFQFPELLNIPSTCKSPQQMFGAIAKSYYAEKIGVKPEDMVVVSIMPCLAKKYEASREEFIKDGITDVDYVLTTRELAQMLKEAGINLDKLKDEEYDNPLGESSGAAVIFGASGGVLEAALRTAYEWITKKTLGNVNFKDVRGMEGVKEATVDIDGLKVNVAVTSGLGNARKILTKIKKGEANYHAIEIMACPGGCLNGGGQPYIHGDTSILDKRLKAIYSIDESKVIRKSHENPYIKKLYDEFLIEPGSHKSHDLLHTQYFKKNK
ncbi:MAG: NADH:ubiquinone oxidoreductase [Spirochaetes bacterium GWF1_31_7]|nr:MAG: NADH:ubiquinone oxidoreductase [Spirochaetes bacterium GWE1_32_154]OHD48506.1 MAG: NADH:ubiquinone oxidoreductase [Spirochaetes bacterium GWE2_31_10]OHD51420.1 MAG: NADH:ubiquinone oxidoreductase [Spirochaetes bacterium GWF1_31_7]OHD79943.1 MAG: NADH:ubiquinone oxidoreductase [Spirochaetes bacterium RIFOXYB1_FULL_32_8]HBD93365.1 NADH:ubiquinone oxidoreductase [Spirochaetia bacterium]